MVHGGGQELVLKSGRPVAEDSVHPGEEMMKIWGGGKGRNYRNRQEL